MSSVFDDNAKAFARDIDKAIEDGCYRRGELFVQLAKQTIPSGSLILDYGCGPGRISLMLARSGFEVVGIDLSELMVEQAQAQDVLGLGLQFRVGDDSCLRSASYDAIVCSSVIEYVEEPDKLLQVFSGWLRGPGVLIISYSNKSSPFRQYARLTGKTRNVFEGAYQHSWRRRGFRELLERNGFECLKGPKFFDLHWRFDRFVESLPLGNLAVVAARKERDQ
jgi:2-polyprenyl-3-methyl-5-hydroxy-6-metoxy-1,4-benzoquinol methylase